MGDQSPKTAVIIGAGPAGLTAAYELLTRTDVHPIVFESDDIVGGIARTVEHNGNRIDIGGHRFFSKSDRVMDWWQRMLPLQALPNGQATVAYQNRTREVAAATVGPDPETEDRVMLVRPRTSRIYFLRSFFSYPISLNAATIRNLGPVRMMRIGFSYLRSMMFPIRNETNLEEFFINRFGRELYATFFRDYTEKVWGVPCRDISAEWGAQRIKGLSITKALAHSLKSLTNRNGDLAQKETETSLIEQFLYPKFGPGQMWQETASQVIGMGGEIHMRHAVRRLEREGDHIARVVVEDRATGEQRAVDADYVISTMPVQHLIRGMTPPAPEPVRDVADNLVYRDFITVGLLVRKLKPGASHPQARSNGSENGRTHGLIPDNWIYIQEPDVKLGRLQIFNNWSPWMVRDPDTVWLGLEYFCDEGDGLWSMDDAAFAEYAARELAQIDLIAHDDVLDHVVIRMPKTYPAYFGSYDRFDTIREFVDGIGNLFLVGRNGMHKYNNQDHSMLTAMVAVDNIAAGTTRKDNIWSVNTEMDYHEEKA